jgi:hypothetical protein
MFGVGNAAVAIGGGALMILGGPIGMLAGGVILGAGLSGEIGTVQQARSASDKFSKK